MKGVIVVLGYENKENGNLTQGAENRAKKAIEVANRKENKSYGILCTGSFGDYYNPTNTPHGKIMADRIRQDIEDEKRVLGHTKSVGTLEDGYLTLRKLREIVSIEKVIIVTSYFHKLRVKTIFSRLLQDYTLEFEGADNPGFLEKEEEVKDSNSKSKGLAKKLFPFINTDGKGREVISHEKKRINEFKNTWVNVSGVREIEDPSYAHRTVIQELRHYDRYSYLAIAGAFITASFALTWRPPSEASFLSALSNVLSIPFIALFGHLYFRLARTANSGRRVAHAIEKVFGHPGITWTNLRPPSVLPNRFDLNVPKTISIILSIVYIYLVSRFLYQAYYIL